MYGKKNYKFVSLGEFFEMLHGSYLYFYCGLFEAYYAGGKLKTYKEFKTDNEIKYEDITIASFSFVETPELDSEFKEQGLKIPSDDGYEGVIIFHVKPFGIEDDKILKLILNHFPDFKSFNESDERKPFQI